MDDVRQVVVIQQYPAEGFGECVEYFWAAPAPDSSGWIGKTLKALVVSAFASQVPWLTRRMSFIAWVMVV